MAHLDCDSLAKRHLNLLKSQCVTHAGIVCNLLAATTKFAAAVFNGSAVTKSEAIHFLVDTVDSLLLIYSMCRAKQLPNQTHPLRYSREIYFWSIVAAILVFALGAGISFYEGVTHILNPEPIQNATMNYVVLAFSALFDGATWWLALRNFRGSLG